MTSNESEMPTESKVNTSVFPFKDKPFFDKGHLKFLYLSPTGRINRKRYWLGALLLYLVFYAPFLLVIMMSDSPEIIIGAYYLMFIVCIYPGLMLCIKRLHDRNRSGHFIWLLAIPIINLWPSIEIAFIKGTSGDNRFGADPLS